ncbi:2-oxoglutarate synthase subunit KorA [Candidatus Gugararchaeum adminiculabundum]|nr:2-oxoglutarate synthase subunit KorA [Candidatus Gugararchaeum adminiculabundum]
MVNEISWKIGGEAGYGIDTSGQAFARCCSRGGLNVRTVSEYPSLIRGGHNTFHVTASEGDLQSPKKELDMLVCLNKETVDRHYKQVKKGGIIVYDADEVKIETAKYRSDVEWFSVPLLAITVELKIDKVMRNTVAVGASIGLLDYDIEILRDMMGKKFAKKGESVISANLGAIDKGYEYVKKNYKGNFKAKLKKCTGPCARPLLNGNDALSIGAIKAGCKFISAYPMTPATSVMINLASVEKEYSIVVKQTEDEIAAVNMTIGASIAGARAMTATSGGGFSLMVEGLSLAGATETPIVIVLAQRPGPSTGLPTWTEQSDLKFALHGGQGEFARILIAPGDHEECFWAGVESFNLTEKWQCPVIILTDKHLADGFSTVNIDESKAKIDRGLLMTDAQAAKETDYKRYEFTANGVSKRAVPGMVNFMHVAVGDEHEEHGRINEDEGNRTDMSDKRNKKLNFILKELPEPKLYGPENAEITLISWGSCKGPVLEAMKELEAQGIKANFLHYIYVWPLKTEKLVKLMDKAKKTVVIENNKTAQLGALISEVIAKQVKYKVLKYNGRQFYPSEITEKVKEIAKNGKETELVVR